MLFLGFWLFVVSLSQLIIGDPSARLKYESVTITQNECEYFGPCTATIQKGTENDLITLTFPTVQELPPGVLISFVTMLPPPLSDKAMHNMTVCDALEDQTVGPSFTKYGVPAFPSQCPMAPAAYSLVDYPGPIDLIPLGFPEGRVDGFVSFGIEGKPPCVLMEYVAHLSRALSVPGFGR